MARTLNPLCYEKNPNFINYMTSSAIPFKAHSQFSKQDIIDRTNLYLRIFEEIWSPDGFDTIAKS
ncbi:hypothetical protein MUP79_09060 [Candidatus Bathyarchaeota archaeon]|nr:hypothetical protein [Candidatus Bathyarchaeota archaeon]